MSSYFSFKVGVSNNSRLEVEFCVPILQKAAGEPNDLFSRRSEARRQWLFGAARDAAAKATQVDPQYCHAGLRIKQGGVAAADVTVRGPRRAVSAFAKWFTRLALQYVNKFDHCSLTDMAALRSIAFDSENDLRKYLPPPPARKKKRGKLLDAIKEDADGWNGSWRSQLKTSFDSRYRGVSSAKESAPLETVEPD